MQEISRFSGIVVILNGNGNDDPKKPRIDVYYGDYYAVMTLDGQVLEGKLPFDQMIIMIGWLKFYEEDIYRNWALEISGGFTDKVPQLKRSRISAKNDVFKDNLYLQGARPMKWGIMAVVFSDGQKRLFDTVQLEEAKYISLRDPDTFKSVMVADDALSFKNGELVITAETVYKYSYKYNG